MTKSKRFHPEAFKFLFYFTSFSSWWWDWHLSLFYIWRFCNQEYASQNAFCRAHLETAPFRRVGCWCCDDYNRVCCSQSLSKAWALQAGGTFWSPQPRLLWLQRACSQETATVLDPLWLKLGSALLVVSVGAKMTSSVTVTGGPGLLLAASQFQLCSDALWKLCPSTLHLPRGHRVQPWGELKRKLGWCASLRCSPHHP